MVDTIGLVNAVAGAPEYNGRMLRQLNAVGFAGATAARPLGARSGVRPGTPSSTVTATSTTWTVQPHAGLIDGQAAAEAGPYAFAFDAVATGPVTAASGSFARVDIVFDQIDDPSESDGSTVPAVTRKYLAGLVANTPQALPARSILLAHINVPISGGGSPTVTWKAPYCAAAGGTVDFNTKSEMDAWLTAPRGQRARVVADYSEYVSDGAGAWLLGAISHIQLNTTNSVAGMVTQYGFGMIAGAAAVSVSENVTFPRPFATTPFPGGAPYIGGRLTGPFNPAGLTEVAGFTYGKTIMPSTTGLTIFISRTDAANLSALHDYYYSWSATGVLA